jgi:four helix bundle protein
MARDHRKLVVFSRARELALQTYRVTQGFPSGERFGLVSQMRRGAVSIGANLVEGCARRSEADFLRFLDIALGSARELQFHAELATDLGFLVDNGALATLADEVSRSLSALATSIRPGVPAPAQDPGPKTQDSK